MKREKHKLNVTYIQSDFGALKDFLKNCTGILDESKLDINDPKIAGILKK